MPKGKKGDTVAITIARRSPPQPTWRIASHTDRVGFVGHGSEALAQALADQLIGAT